MAHGRRPGFQPSGGLSWNTYWSETKSYEGKKYQINNPYKNGGVLSLKGQLHCHSTNSDGADSPSALVTAYKNAGYNFVAITDHDFVTPDPMVSGMTFIQSCEELSGDFHAHIPAYDITEQSTSKVNSEVINFHSNNNSLVSIAHPKLGTLSVSDTDIKTLQNYNFIEVFNSFESKNRESVFDMALSAGKKVFCTAVDDCHNIVGTMFNKGWVVVKADINDKAHVMDSLRNGNFYSSNGNDISLLVEGNIITASSSASSNITFYGLDGKVLQTNVGTLSATYTIKGDETYIRVTSTKASDGTIAWSNPIFIDSADTSRVETNINKNAYSNDNTILNGEFDVWQRGTSFSNPVSYTADRWRISTNATTYNVSRQSVSDESQYACRLELLTGGASFSDLILMQPLESQDSYRFRGKTITYSALVRKNVSFNTGTFELNIYSGKGADEWNVLTGRIVDEAVYNYSDISTTEWTRVKLTATIQNDRTQLAFLIGFRDGTVPNGSYLEIKEVKVDIGDSVLPFQQRTFGEELNLCKRYYEKSYDYGVPPVSNGHVKNYALFFGSNTSQIFNYNPSGFKVQKRTTPAVNIYSLIGTENAVSDMAGSDIPITNPSISVGENGIAIITAGSGTPFVVGANYRFHWTSDAEI